MALLLLLLLLCARSSDRATEPRFRAVQLPLSAALLPLLTPLLHTTMPHTSPDAKHHILLEYAAHDDTRSFAALAARHAIPGGERTVRRWHRRWDGTPRSLERKAGSGKARVLSRAEVSRHVRAPILAANRAHRAIHYTELLPRVQAATGKELSIQTLRRYGKEVLRGRDKPSKKRTAAESECSSACETRDTSLCVELWTDSVL